MAIVFPSKAIAQQWDGALQASLKRARLERFLRTRDLKVAPRGPARDSDNICRAALFILRAPLAGRTSLLSEPQWQLIGHLTCNICDRLAKLIEEPQSWRVAALVGTAQLLFRDLGLSVAANFAAVTAREYHSGMGRWCGQLAEVSDAAADAVAENNEQLIQRVRADVATLLDETAERSTATTCLEPVASGAL